MLDYSSVEKLVTVPLSVGDRGLAAVGRSVTVTLPDDREGEGTISEVGSVVTEGTVVVTVTIADRPALSGIEVASVDVEFVSDSRDQRCDGSEPTCRIQSTVQVKLPISAFSWPNSSSVRSIRGGRTGPA